MRGGFIKTTMLAVPAAIFLLAGPFSGKALGETADVTFQSSVLLITGSFSSLVETSDLAVAPGDSVDLAFNAAQGPGSLVLDLGDLGSPTVTFDTPLGVESIEVGVAGAGVDVNLVGSLNGPLSVTGPATLSVNSLAWSDWGTQSARVDISGATPGDTVSVTLGLVYTVSAGVTLPVPLLPDVTLIPPTSLGRIPGSPTVTATVTIVEPSFVALLLNNPLLLGGLLVGIAVVVAVATLALRRRKRR